MSQVGLSKNYSGVLSEITIIIFSRNRPRELMRSIKYWNALDISCLVLDNSEHKLEINPAATSVKYFYCPHQNFSQRSLIASEHIETKYSIICSDDERYLKSSLEFMVEEMNNSPELESIGAHAVAVGTYGPIKYGNFVYSQMLNYENVASNLLERLENHFNLEINEWPIGAMYRVVRSRTLIRLLLLFYKCDNISTPYVYEVTSELFITGAGNSKYINDIFWVRNWETPAINKSDWDRKLTFSEWWENEKFLHERKKWIVSLEQGILSSMSKIEMEEILDRIAKKRKSTDRFPEKSSNFLIKNEFIKYYIKRIFAPRLLPKNIKSVLLEIQNQGLHINIGEIEYAISDIFE
jgi:glycosyltransferase domain-containing protein